MPQHPKTLPVQTGDLWSIHVPKVGYFPLIIARAPNPEAAVPFSFGYLDPRPSPAAPRPKTVAPLADWEHAWIGLLPSLPFTSERWTRIGPLPAFDPDEWPIAPGQRSNYSEADVTKDPDLAKFRLCSIETTRDEPTMTILESAGADAQAARDFPIVQTITKASDLEKALANHSLKKNGGVWGLDLELSKISPDRINRWRKWATQARERCSDQQDPAIPAGRTTDRRVKAGDWLGFPLPGGGFGAALVVRRKAGAVIFGDALVYTFPKIFDFYPTPDQLESLRPEDACLLRGTSLIVVRDGRWRVLGEHPRFDPQIWVVPHSWHQTTSQRESGDANIHFEDGRKVTVRLPPKSRDLDPLSASVTSTNSSAYSIEGNTSLFARRSDSSKIPEWVQKERLTPARINNWRTLNKLFESLAGQS